MECLLGTFKSLVNSSLSIFLILFNNWAHQNANSFLPIVMADFLFVCFHGFLLPSVTDFSPKMILKYFQAKKVHKFH